MAVFGRRARRGDEDTPVGAEIPEPDPVVAHDDADEQAADELEVRSTSTISTTPPWRSWPGWTWARC